MNSDIMQNATYDKNSDNLNVPESLKNYMMT